MPIDTNLNVSPYFDDFDETKNFHRVLFRPSVAVQARELTQLQTILQNQIERFGDNIYRVGTIIRGCSLSTDYSYNYIKILDNQADGLLVDLDNYSNTLLIQTSSNLHALVLNSKPGLQSQNPDLNTLYIKYINTGSAGQKTYSNNDLITIYDRDRTVEAIEISNGGTGYSNSDTVVFSGGGGSGAVASITTFANGTIRDVSVTNKGSGYTSAPGISITTSGGTSAVLTAKIFIAQVRVANSSFTDPVGIGTSVRTTDGIIYQKGNFVRVTAQEEVLSKYNNTPSNVAVGFVVNETIVNSSIDTTLLDNAAGSSNFSAPGANRLKLTPQLVVLNRSDAAANNDFLSLLEFENGNKVKDRTVTEFNSIKDELSKRTFEESGNYVVSQFPLSTVEKIGNTSHFDLVVGAGVGYVGGSRIELLNNVKIPVRKGEDFANSSLQTIATVYGSYVVVKELLGAFDIKNGSTVTLRSAAATDVTDNFGGTPTVPGTQLGVAKVRSLEYEGGQPGTGNATYRLYLFDIHMSRGASFQAVRAIATSGGAVADVVLEGGLAKLKDFDNDKLIFNSGTFAVKEFNNETFIFRTSSNGNFLSSGNLSLTFSGGNTLPYGISQLTAVLKNQFIVIPTTTIVNATNKTGSVAVANATTSNVTGTSTLFTSEYRVGDYIKIGTKNPFRIATIHNDALITVSGTPGSAVANVHTIAYPANVPIDFNTTGKIIEVTSNTGLTVSLGHTITSSAGAVVYHDMQNFEPAVKQKTVSSPVYVKISSSQFNRSQTGPWCLGIPDVYEITGVFVGSGGTYANTSTTNYKNSFLLDDGQKDNYYGLSFIKRKSGSSVPLTATSNLLVELRCFTHGSGKYISTESYPIDDSNTYNSNTSVKTQQIPVFISPTTGEFLPLSDALDFRPILANTANLSSTIAGATIDPVITETFVAGEKFFPSPSKSFEAIVQSYLGRSDRVIMESAGQIKIIEGLPSNRPSPPPTIKGTMDLGIIKIAPFPSLSAKEAADAGRPELGNTIRLSQTRRYTMKDIGSIEDRIKRLEYYTSLSILEANTKNLTLVSEANTEVERFKNGFLVDPFNNYDISNLDDSEYNALIDVKNSRLSPTKTVTDIELKYSSGGEQTGELVTLPYSEQTLVNQSYANRERTLVERFWNFKGRMKVVPSYDNFFDTTTSAVSSIAVDIATPLESLTKSINTALSKLNVSSELLNSITNVVDTFEDGNQVRTTTVTNTFTDTTNVINVQPSVTNTQEVGNFLTNVSVNPFIRAQKIAFYASGLRPGAQHYVFFDGVNLTSNTTPAILANFTNVTLESFRLSGAKGSTLTANSTGELAVVIDIPGGTFSTGDKSILVMDFDSLDAEDSATSKAVGKFSSFTLSGDKTRVTFSTKSFDSGSFSSSTFNTSRIVTDVRREIVPPPAPGGGDGGGGGGDGGDPLAQTFRVQPQVNGSDTVFITSVDVFFKQKDPTFGVRLDIRETDSDGFPTTIILPFSLSYKKSSEVNVSNNASLATTFTFESPVAVSVGRDYSITLIADAYSPEYRIWTGETGGTDVTDPTKVVNSSWGLGTLFYSTSGGAYSAAQGEDIKFKVNYAQFSPLSNTVTLTNGDQEFLTISNTVGTFVGGEDVAQLGPTYINAQLTTNTATSVIQTSSDLSSSLGIGDWIAVVYESSAVAKANVSVTGTTVTNTTASAFTTDFSVGDFIKLGSSNGDIRQVVSIANNTQLTIDANPIGTYTNHAISSIVPLFDVLRVIAANSSTITVHRTPKTNSSSSVAASFQEAVRGRVTLFNGSENKLYLNNSTSSNSTFLIRSSNSTYLGTIISAESSARTRVSSINDIPLSSFKPLINYMTLQGTSMSLSGTFTSSSNTTFTQNLFLNNDNTFDVNNQAVVKSKTNEISGATVTKSLSLDFDMSSSRNDVSPVIDISPSSIVAVSYNVNGDSTDEYSRFGNASAKYVSKRLVLAEGLDAEDIKVYLSAYRPTNTDIKVYAKILNAIDPEPFDTRIWSELELTSSDVFSSSLDVNDLREYEYTFKRSPLAYKLPGSISTFSNTTVEGSNTFFLYDFNANTAVDPANDFITIASNKFIDNDILTYVVPSGNTPITNLNSPFKLIAYDGATVNAAGSGYVSGDIVALQTGEGTPARYAVTANGTGNVTSVSVVSQGDYTTAPSTSNVATLAISGTGTGLTLNVLLAQTHGPFYAVQANSSGVKLSLTSNGTPIELTKGLTETHTLKVLNTTDIVKVVKTNTETDYEIFPVSAVIDANTIVLAGNVSHTTGGISLEKVQLKEAFKYAANPAGNNIVRYFDNESVSYDGYRVLAIKIVLLSQNDYQVPLVNDVRAIAVSI